MSLSSLLLETLALVGGTVHSLVPGEAPREATIVIEDGHITAVGVGLAVPSGAQVVDVRGLHLIPGLIDGFAYHDPEHDLLYTAAGVTLVRDHGNDLSKIFESRELEQRDANVGPTLSISGAVFDGVPPSTAASLVVRNTDEARDALTRLSDEQIDFVAFQSNLTAEPWRSLCKTAAEKKLQVWGPLLKGMKLEDALAGGQSGFVFLDCLLPSGATWDSAEIVACEPAAKKLAAAGARVTPVLRERVRTLENPAAEHDELNLLSPQYGVMWVAEAEQRAKTIDDASKHKIEVLLGKQRALLSILFKAGVVLVPGSGAPHPWLMPGEGLRRELLEWQGAGIPAADVLRAATSGAAKALGLDGERGTLAVGKLADIVALRADPELDVAALAEVDQVVLRGKLLTRPDLDRRLAALTERQRVAREALNKPIEVAEPTLPDGQVLLAGRVQTTVIGPYAAERWAIVRELDDTLTFCGKRVVRPGGDSPNVTFDVRQRVSNGRFASFEVTAKSGSHEMVVRGFQLGDQWRIERRRDGGFIDNRAAVDKLAAIDAGSVTTMMLLAHTRAPGAFPVLRFDEGLEVEVVRWDLALDDDGDHAFRTPQGLKAAGFFENGALKMVVEQSGQSSLQTMSMEIDDRGGAGLPLPEDKLALMRKAAKAQGASSPRDGK
jgi:hypothetical protein